MYMYLWNLLYKLLNCIVNLHVQVYMNLHVLKLLNSIVNLHVHVHNYITCIYNPQGAYK